ncbi:hypothetical protein B4110_3794 [Parageobacillus toebii]|uniref:Uncharacterized protein n=1 Tax=Parageobacillus toebii TaxID=153151 RepID=A0A150MNC7_9BACL|nr:hypothetical protein B4110_3794 [Parageobacillus toebii]
MRFYLTYEELKPERDELKKQLEECFYLTYEELKPGRLSQNGSDR